MKTLNQFKEKWDNIYINNEAVRKAIDRYLGKRTRGESLYLSELENILADEKYKIASELIDDITTLEYNLANQKHENQ